MTDLSQMVVGSFDSNLLVLMLWSFLLLMIFLLPLLLLLLILLLLHELSKIGAFPLTFAVEGSRRQRQVACLFLGFFHLLAL